MDGWVGDELIMKQDHQLPNIYMKPKKRGFSERWQNYACREQGLTGMISSHPSASFVECGRNHACGHFQLSILGLTPHGLIRVILKINHTTNNYNYLSHALSSI